MYNFNSFMHCFIERWTDGGLKNSSIYLHCPQVNRELMVVIEGLQHKTEEDEEASGEGSGDEKGPDSSSGHKENNMPHPQAEEELKRKTNDASLLIEQEPERTRKRRKIDAEDGLSKIDAAEKENDEAEAAMDEGIDSPSSPLNVRSDEDIQ